MAADWQREAEGRGHRLPEAQRGERPQQQKNEKGLCDSVTPLTSLTA